ncbi:MAG: NUDIX hydrolase [Ilumatobacteraceae bacterium]|jgi:8-oxo-dGTP pyrophosphatase MutT (NUDIX family)|nr:NUDIX hydrolase [Ilumatobacteraceae bacterium]NQW59476.1 NUDIX hydrolase [bacterium]
MKIHEDVPVRMAATVMLVRDDEVSKDIEVFVMQRTLKAAFAGGLYVFPGGKLDDIDGGSHIEHLCDGLTDEEASGLLQISSGGLAFWVAAIRECFEEAGVLLARDTKTGEYIRFDDADVAARFEAYRHEVHDGKLGMHELCEKESLRLATDAIEYVSHWITPVGEPRRFDTRFFLARAPQAQDPLHDDGETIASLWVSPNEALAMFERGELAMMPPTVRNLEFLQPHRTADDALVAATKVGIPPAILPRIRVDSEGKVLGVVLPGEPGYDELA